MMGASLKSKAIHNYDANQSCSKAKLYLIDLASMQLLVSRVCAAKCWQEMSARNLQYDRCMIFLTWDADLLAT